MGEESAARENIACNNPANSVFCLDNHPHIAMKIGFLNSSFADKFICVHNDASGYIALRLKTSLEEALMIERKGINGEMSIGF
jgi:hypothetical protein